MKSKLSKMKKYTLEQQKEERIRIQFVDFE
jgi:hypothetical protein